MKNKAPKTSKEVLLTLLRKKQNEEGFGYITTKSTSYKILRWLFFAAVVYCTLINLFYILGKSGEMAANLAYMGNPEPHQELEISRLYTTLNIMVVSAVGVFLSEVALWFKLPLLQIIFSFSSSIVIIARLSSEINDPTGNVLVTNHIIPLAIMCVLAAVSGGLHLRQLKKDKECCEDINTIIYEKFGVVAKDVSPDEWDNILKAYKPEKIERQKRLKKEEKKNKQKESISDNNFNN